MHGKLRAKIFLPEVCSASRKMDFWLQRGKSQRWPFESLTPVHQVRNLKIKTIIQSMYNEYSLQSMQYCAWNLSTYFPVDTGLYQSLSSLFSSLTVEQNTGLDLKRSTTPQILSVRKYIVDVASHNSEHEDWLLATDRSSFFSPSSRENGKGKENERDRTAKELGRSSQACVANRTHILRTQTGGSVTQKCNSNLIFYRRVRSRVILSRYVYAYTCTEVLYMWYSKDRQAPASVLLMSCYTMTVIPQRSFPVSYKYNVLITMRHQSSTALLKGHSSIKCEKRTTYSTWR